MPLPRRPAWRLLLPLLTIVAVAALTALAAARPPKPTHDYPVQPVPFTAVRLDDVFWAPRIETNPKGTISAAVPQCERSGRVNTFERAAQALRGEPHDKTAPPYPFDDTDLY